MYDVPFFFFFATPIYDVPTIVYKVIAYVNGLCIAVLYIREWQSNIPKFEKGLPPRTVWLNIRKDLEIVEASSLAHVSQLVLGEIYQLILLGLIHGTDAQLKLQNLCVEHFPIIILWKKETLPKLCRVSFYQWRVCKITFFDVLFYLLPLCT